MEHIREGRGLTSMLWDQSTEDTKSKKAHHEEDEVTHLCE